VTALTALPPAVHLDLDPSVRTFRGGAVLTGGFPGRLVVLSDEGARALDRLMGSGPLAEADRRLGRRLVAAGMAHPRLSEGTEANRPPPGVTVVVPARDRPHLLDRCLASLGGDAPVVVVDDGSDDPATVAAVCERRGARLLRLPENRGPGAARNHALAAIDTELVALVDSDCTVGEGWLGGLTPLFDDAELGAVAPRVRSRSRQTETDRTVLARFADAHSPLDMGPERGEVGPGRKIRYAPTAALVARRAALAEGFDPDLRVGEDVDLVWRMSDAGWRIRFEPSVTVWHEEPRSWAAWVRRRFRYGTSAGPLARRHPGRLAPVELRAWPSAIVAAGLGGRAALSGALVTVSTALTFRGVRRHGIPLGLVARWSADGAGWTLLGLGRASTTLAAPVLLLVAGRGRRRARFAALVLLLAPPLVEWWRRRPGIDPLRWSLACIVDDLAYGAGVWSGCVRSRCAGPLLPALRARQWAASPDPCRVPSTARGDRM
jgi:mycofactocin system glycosyltransferase